MIIYEIEEKMCKNKRNNSIKNVEVLKKKKIESFFAFFIN